MTDISVTKLFLPYQPHQTLTTMKSFLLACFTLLILFSCQKDEEMMNVENADWYILTAPDARAIEGVYGNIDGTIIISTGKNIYRTDDKGKTWQTSNYNSNHGTFSFAMLRDTLFVLNTQSTMHNTSDSELILAKNPSFYSLDQGLTWFPYNEVFYPEDGPIVLLNKAYTTAGTEYQIDKVNDGGYIETVGIKTSAGQKISLPQNHQIKSVYFDKKDRLYVAASAAVCGSKSNFAFCKGENGIVYVSKAVQK
jgi:hypothetical protein